MFYDCQGFERRGMIAKNKLTRSVQILLVEDSLSDANLTREALKESGVAHHLSHVEDGVEAMKFLRREDKYADAPQVDLILLDLNMPRMNGCEVLSEIRGDSALRHLVVVVLTTSASDKDILEAYSLNANSYVQKPVDLNKFFQVIKDIHHFFFEVIHLPPKPAP